MDEHILARLRKCFRIQYLHMWRLYIDKFQFNTTRYVVRDHMIITTFSFGVSAQRTFTVESRSLKTLTIIVIGHNRNQIKPGF